MAKISKRMRDIKKNLDKSKIYSVSDAISMLKNFSSVKFVESVDVAIHLAIDAKKTNQTVRGAFTLPHGSGRLVKVAVFAEGKEAEDALAQGADRVGMQDLASDIKSNKDSFDIIIAAPYAMGLVGTLGTILGPKGLMPNAKLGTVTQDVALAVKNAKTGQVKYRNDKNGILHILIGKLNFENNALIENLSSFLSHIERNKPAAVKKGIFIKKITISSTMGPGITIDHSSLESSIS